MNIKNFLSFEEADILYKSVIAGLYDEKGEFLYQYEEYVWRKVVVLVYTDVVMPEDENEAYELCYDETLWGIIESKVNQTQYNHIRNAVRQYVYDHEARTQHSLMFSNMAKDMETILTAIGNMENLPMWLADQDDKSEHPLTQVK